MPRPARTKSPSDRRLAALERQFKALSDRTRLRILGLLAAGEVCVCHIHESLRIPQPRASRHLAYLRRCGLVDTRREGLWVYYRLATPSDPLSADLQQSVRQLLARVDEMHADMARLRKAVGEAGPIDEPTGCCEVPAEVTPAPADS